MGNLAQYRLSVALFALGVLFVVSEVMGDGDKPGALDTATRSITHRLNAATPGQAGSDGPYEVAVTQTTTDDTPQPTATHAANHAANPWALSPGDSDEEDEPAARTQAPLPAEGPVIHK